MSLEHFTETADIDGVAEKERCRASVKIFRTHLVLVCTVEQCPISLGEGEVIGRHNSTELLFDEIRRSAILEIPDVCPRLADYDKNSPQERLPRSLRTR